MISAETPCWETNTNANTNNLFPPFPSDTIMFIYDNYDNKYDNTMSCSCLLFKMIGLITMNESLELGFWFTLLVRTVLILGGNEE